MANGSGVPASRRLLRANRERGRFAVEPDAAHRSEEVAAARMSGRLRQPRPHPPEPVPAPLERGFLGQDAARGIVLMALADALRAELGQDVVETLAAEIEGLGVGPVAQAEHPVAHLRQAWALRLEILVQGPGVVRHVALAVSRGADQEYPVAREHRAVEVVHEQGLDLSVAVVERQLHFLRAELRGSGHGADQKRDFQIH